MDKDGFLYVESAKDDSLDCESSEAERRELDAQDQFRCQKCSKVFDCEEHNGRCYCKSCQFLVADHPQVLSEQGYVVDIKICGLIDCLNKNGCKTVNSCQLNDKIRKLAWVQFGDPSSKHGLIRLAKQHHRLLYNYLVKQIWSDHKVNEYVTWCSLRFPARDIDQLTRWISLMYLQIAKQ
jgi:hypothetical protein